MEIKVACIFQASIKAPHFNSGGVFKCNPPFIKWGGFEGASPFEVGGVWDICSEGQIAPRATI